MTPMPPSRASAMAISDSVTVSMAALTIGMGSAMRREKRVTSCTSRGCTSERRGTSSTSSNVRASGPTFSLHAIRSLTVALESVEAAAPAPRLSGSLRVLLPGQAGRRGLPEARQVEVVVHAEAQRHRHERTVVARGELIVALREDVMPFRRHLDAGRRKRHEEALGADLEHRARVDPAMQPEADRVLQHLAVAFDPHAVRAGPGAHVPRERAAAQHPLQL